MKKAIISLLSLLFVIVFISCNYSLFSAAKETVVEDNSDTINSDEAFDDSQVPVLLSASDAEYIQKIVISWQDVSGADYYTVQRACLNSPFISENIDENSWQTISKRTKATTFEDTQDDILIPSYFAYRIRAFNQSSNKSTQYSNILCGASLSAVCDVSATKGSYEDKIEITWKEVPGIKKYEVYKDGNTSAIAVVNSCSSSVEKTYMYEVLPSERGCDICFTVKALNGDNNANVDKVITRLGYSAHDSSMLSPQVDGEYSKGSGNSSISLRIKKDDSERLVITRFSSGENENIVYPLSEDDFSLENSTVDENGFLEFRDEKDIAENVLYTYSVAFYNDTSKSMATAVNGYILSSPIYASLNVTKKNGVDGYELKITPPIGFENHNDWTFVCEETYQNEEVKENEYSSENPPFFPVASSENDENYKDEIRQIRIKTKNSASLLSQNSKAFSVSGIPELRNNFKATKNVYESGMNVNKNGAYPVLLSWDSDDKELYYSVKRVSEKDASVKEFTFSGAEYAFEDTSAEVGVKYTYSLSVCDVFGRSKGSVEAGGAYSAISHDVFSILFEKHCLKPWIDSKLHPEWVSGSKNKIFKYVNAAGMRSLGSHVEYGDYKHSGNNGFVSYNAKVKGLGGYVTFKYRNFGECDFMYISGDAQYCMDSNISGTGDVVEETVFNIGGMYPGSVDFSSLSLVNQAFSGNYIIKQMFNTLAGESSEIEKETKPL